MEPMQQKEPIYDRIARYCSGIGMNEVNLHAEGMKLFYTKRGEETYYVHMLSSEVIGQLTVEVFRAQCETIRRIFTDRGFSDIKSLVLFFTGDLMKVRELGEGTNFWIVDERYGRLVIFENQCSDFLGLRQIIEQNLHFGADVRNRDGVQRTGVTPQGTRTVKRRNTYRSSLTNGSQGVAFITYALVAINVLIYFLQKNWDHNEVLLVGANNWHALFEEKEVYRVFTSMFLHSGLEHLLNNMLVLFLVGSVLEIKIGHWRYITAYFIAGICSSVISAFYHMSVGANVYCLGASGAIYGLVGTLVFIMVATRDSEDYGTLGRLGFFVLYMFYQVFASDANVDNAAHVGGLITGALIGCFIYLSVKRREEARRNSFRM